MQSSTDIFFLSTLFFLRHGKIISPNTTVALNRQRLTQQGAVILVREHLPPRMRGIFLVPSLLSVFLRLTQFVASFQSSTNSPTKQIPRISNPSARRRMAGSVRIIARRPKSSGFFERENFDDWGWEENEDVQAAALVAPMWTPDIVVDESFDAIAGTLCNQQKLDPAIASNAFSNSIFDDRPIRSSSSAGRIGIEIDGAQHLFPSIRRISRNRAIRRVALLLAGKMAVNSSWSKYDKCVARSEFRPVVMLFQHCQRGTASQQRNAIPSRN
jgi:hypothetical protein